MIADRLRLVQLVHLADVGRVRVAWSASCRARARSRSTCSATVPRPGRVTVTR